MEPSPTQTVPSLFDLTLHWFFRPPHAHYLHAAVTGESLSLNNNNNYLNVEHTSGVWNDLETEKNLNQKKLPLCMIEQELLPFYKARQRNVDVLLKAMGRFKDEKVLDLRGVVFSWPAFFTLWAQWKESLASLCFERLDVSLSTWSDIGASNLLETLILRDCPVSEEGLFLLSKNFPNLRTLDISTLQQKNKIRNPDTALSFLSNLTALDISGWEQLTDAGLREVSRNCPALVSVAFGRCRRISDKGFSDFLGVNSSRNLLGSLRIINISSCLRLTDHTLKQLSYCTHLESLHMNNNNLFTDAGVESLAPLKSLKEIDICYCHSLTNKAIDAITQNFPMLESLLSGFSKGMDDKSVSFLQRSVHLENLFFCGYFALTDTLLSSFTFPSLQTLNLWRCDEITDAAFIKLLSHSPRLEKILIGSANRLTDKTLEAMAAYTPHLQTLIIGGLHLFTDKGVVLLSQNCKALETLDILSSSNITDQALQALAANCQKLWYLDIRNCPAITDLGISALAHDALSLSYLDLGGCTNPTVESLISLLQKRSHVSLNTIDVRKCPKIQAEEAQKFANDYPNVIIRFEKTMYKIDLSK